MRLSTGGRAGHIHKDEGFPGKVELQYCWLTPDSRLTCPRHRWTLKDSKANLGRIVKHGISRARQAKGKESAQMQKLKATKL